MASYPRLPGLGLLLAAMGLWMVFEFGHWIGYVPLVLGVLELAAFMASIRPWFRGGDVCAACIISESPLLVASFTDMAISGAWFPAVRVRREPRRRFPAEMRTAGRRLVTIARYQGDIEAETWNDFTPLPVQCATGDEAEVRRLVNEISTERWQELEKAVRLLPKPYKPGVYRLWEMPRRSERRGDVASRYR